jgi:hypothetical protein
MKKTVLYIIAIPIGLIASMVLPKIFETILDFFIPFEGINNFIDNYIMKIFSGWIAVGVTVLVAPSKKILLGIVMLLLNIVATIYMYTKGDEFNYLFIIGGILAFIFAIMENSNKKEETLEI